MITNGEYTVYCHINKENGKKYIGITKTTVEKRWHNGKGYSGQPKFYRAICKYGWNGFDHEIVASNLTEEEAKNFEILLIEKLDSIKNGYNVSRGGDTGNGVAYTEEMKKAMSDRFKGENNPRYGVKLDQETKDKISKTLTGRKYPDRIGGNNPMARKIVVGDKIFGSIEECATYLNYSPDTLQSWLSLDSKPPQAIVDIGFGYLGEEKLKEGYKRRTRHSITLCEGVEYKTAKACAEYYGVQPSTMVKWLNGINPMPKEWKEKNLHYKQIHLF